MRPFTATPAARASPALDVTLTDEHIAALDGASAIVATFPQSFLP